MVQLFDSRTRELQVITESNNLKIYLCGPTVYDDVHIGNIAPVLTFDFLIRYLREKNINYTYIHNITDIDDKIVNKAKELQVDESEISTKYEQRYLDILKELNIITPTHMPRVSDHIKEIHDVISNLEKENYTQIVDGDVVFNLHAVKEYGEVSKQNIDNLTNVSDFCLWKKITEGKTWDSPWGIGRPGWHTECFAFIEKYCGGTVDIHGGGVDLKFPHHENENAHCRALHKESLAKIWVHIGHLSTEQGKISKSDNKKYLAKDMLKEYSANIIRLLFLTHTYSAPSLITDEKLQNLKNEWNSFEHAINKAITSIYIHSKTTELNKNIEIEEQFLGFIKQDLNLPQLLTWLQLLKKDLLSEIKQNNYEQIKLLGSKLNKHIQWLGFRVPQKHTQDNLNLIDKWQEMVKSQNWEEADKLRNILINEGII